MRISACLSSIEKAIDISTITEVDKVNGIYYVCSIYHVCSKNSEYSIDIKGGNCICPYYMLRQILCKHMFCIFQNFCWTWDDLPSSCTQCPHMTLDNGIDMYVNEDDFLLADQQDDAHNHDNSSTVMHSLIPIPPYQTAGLKLFFL